MQDEMDWNWIERLFRRLPLSHSTLSLITGGMVLIIYLIFMLGIEYKESEYSFYSFAQVLFLCITMTYLLLGNQHIVEKFGLVFQQIEFIKEDAVTAKELYDQIVAQFFKSKNFFILLVVVALPPIVVSYVYSPRFNSTLLNIYNYIIFFFMLYLLATIFWIILSVSTTLEFIAKEPYRNFLKIDLYNVDRIGGLGRMSDFIMGLVIYYSVGISLAVLSYVDPTGYESVKFEIAFLLLLLLAGLILLFKGLQFLQKIFRERMFKELNDINEKYLNKYKILTESIADGGSKSEGDLQFALKSMEALRKEREEREALLYDNEKRFSLTAGIVTLISIILPLLTLFEKMNDFGAMNMILKAFNITT